MLHTPPIFQNDARSLLDRAMANTVAQCSLDDLAQVRQRVQHGDCNICDQVRLNLARQIAEYLADANRDLRAVYWYDPAYAVEDYDRLRTGLAESSAINLLVWTGGKKSDLAEMIGALQTGTRAASADLLCPKANDLCYNLNVAVVDDVEVKARRGYAALIDSLWVHPTRLWSRV